MADVFGGEIPYSDEFSEEVVLFESDANPGSTDMGQEGIFKLDDDQSSTGSEETSAEPVHPLTTLQKLVESDLVLDRQIATRSVLDTLSEVAPKEDDVHALVSLIFKLSGDPEFVVRVQMVAEVPDIAAFCRDRENLEMLVTQQLVPLTVNHLTDNEPQVRKASHTALLALLEKNLVDNERLTKWICPLVAELSRSSNRETKTEATSLMCKMASLVGKDIFLKFFLENFGHLCGKLVTPVREICSSYFGIICQLVGTEITESTLLDRFDLLCKDITWEVKKNCADVFVDVSSVVTGETRRSMLTENFILLLCDDSRWVRLAAYRSLGAVIATFADPSKTGLKYCEDGSVIEVPAMNQSFPESKEQMGKENAACDMETNTSAQTVVEGPSPDNLIESPCSSMSNSTSQLQSAADLNQNGNSQRTENTCTEFLSPDLQSNSLECTISGNVVNSTETEQRNYDEEMTDQQEIAAGDSCPTSQKLSTNLDSQKTDLCGTTPGSVNAEFCSRPWKDISSNSPVTVVAKDGSLHLHLENENNFNNFQYWRVPMPDLELDIDIKNGRTTSIHVRAKVHDEKSDKVCASDLNVKIAPVGTTPSADPESCETSTRAEEINIQSACMNTIINEDLEDGSRASEGRINVTNSSFSETSVVIQDGELSGVKRNKKLLLDRFQSIEEAQKSLGSLMYSPCLDADKSAYEQDIVPPKLLKYFIGMVETVQSQTVGTEMPQLCAHSFPAVVYTLGKKYWPCVNKLCDVLAKDMQWKVRRTMAASLHELAAMLGSDITAEDLLPIFLAFLKDLDEVRVAVLSHLPEFLKLLKPSERREFLPLTKEFDKVDNERNWRYRAVLAQQLSPAVEFFSPSDVREFLVPIAMWLATDKVCEVRHAAVKLIAIILRRLSQNTESDYASWLMTEINEKFRHSQKWLWRQMYAYICEHFALERSLPFETFINDVVPNLLTLTWDNIPNIRLAVARCLAETLLPLGYFPCIQRTHYQLLLQVMFALQCDVDRDVRYFAHVTAEAFSVLPQKKQ